MKSSLFLILYKSANSIPFPFTIKFLFIGFMNFLCNIKYSSGNLPTISFIYPSSPSLNTKPVGVSVLYLISISFK
uniref:Uncharacterized protein n=1 Tax=Staphylococcus aureus TaxID=1280 RepID=Q9K357_STAAU|nr:hypothetical protein [Staphylococcus aureus]